jgi:hypothetical protein
MYERLSGEPKAFPRAWTSFSEVQEEINGV